MEDALFISSLTTPESQFSGVFTTQGLKLWEWLWPNGHAGQSPKYQPEKWAACDR